MYDKTQNLSKLLCFTDVLCDFADSVTDYEYHDCQFTVEIDDDEFNFDLPELVAEVRKYHKAVIDDIENCSDKRKSIFAEPFVPEFTTEKTSNDEIITADFDYFRRGMPYTIKKVFDLMLPLSIIEEAKSHEKATEPMTKETRIKAIEMHTMLRLAQIAVS